MSDFGLNEDALRILQEQFGNSQTGLPGNQEPPPASNSAPADTLDPDTGNGSGTTSGSTIDTILGNTGAATTQTQDNTPPVEDSQTVTEFNAGQVGNPNLPPGATVDPALMTPGTGELIDPNDFQAGGTGQKTAQTGTAQTAAAPEAISAATMEAATIGQAAQATAAQGTVSDAANPVAITQDQLSPELRAEFDKFQAELNAIGVDPQSTVQGQYSTLMDFEAGEIPPWAKGAYKAAQQHLAARGIADSTIAGEVITSTLMQAAMPIAMQDAKVFETMSLTKLDKKTQGFFLRAGYVAQLDMQNLNNRQQASVIKAQNFFNMDMANLNNRQQTAVVNTQMRMQKMLANQAAKNTARQFNATSQNQINTFYSDLSARMDSFNTAQQNAMSQFNINEENTMTKFNAQMDEQRQQFNVANATAIEQSNAQYLRNVNTVNTAAINNANLVNSQNLLSISNTALANEIQLWRDNEAFFFQSGENALDRSNNRALVALQNDAFMQRLSANQRFQAGQATGGFFFDVARDIIGGIDFGDVFGGGDDDETFLDDVDFDDDIFNVDAGDGNDDFLGDGSNS